MTQRDKALLEGYANTAALVNDPMSSLEARKDATRVILKLSMQSYLALGDPYFMGQFLAAADALGLGFMASAVYSAHN